MAKRIVYKFIPFVAAIFVMACNKSDSGGGGRGAAPAPVPAPVAPAEVTGGDDMKSDFLYQYAGMTYQLPAIKSEAAGFPSGSQKFSVLSGGHYELTIVNQEITAPDGSRVSCTVNETGDIAQVQKVKNNSAILAGNKALATNGLQGVIVLKPIASEVVKAESTVPANGKSQLTPAGVSSLCTRTNNRFIMVGNFLPNAILLATNKAPPAASEIAENAGNIKGESGTSTLTGNANTKPQAFYLQDTLLVRDKNEWLWLTDDLARQAVVESQKYLNKGVKGLQIGGTNIKTLEEKDAQSNITIHNTFDQNSSRVSIEVGTNVAGTFLPLLDVAGTLKGVSFQPSSGELVYNLTDYKVAQAVPRLDASSGLNVRVQKALLDAAKDMGDEVAVLQQNSSNKILDVGINTSEDARIQFRVKPAGVTVIAK